MRTEPADESARHARAGDAPDAVPVVPRSDDAMIAVLAVCRARGGVVRSEDASVGDGVVSRYGPLSNV